MTTIVLEANPDAHVACDMTGAPDTPAERFAEYARLFAHALTERTRTAEGVTFTFDAKAGVAEWITDLARREAACCPFFTFHIEVAPDRVVWRWSSPAGPQVQTFFDELYRLPERSGEGLDELLARLKSRGAEMEISLPAP